MFVAVAMPMSEVQPAPAHPSLPRRLGQLSNGKWLLLHICWLSAVHGTPSRTSDGHMRPLGHSALSVFSHSPLQPLLPVFRRIARSLVPSFPHVLGEYSSERLPRARCCPRRRRDPSRRNSASVGLAGTVGVAFPSRRELLSPLLAGPPPRRGPSQE